MSFLAKFIHRQFIYEPPVPKASFKGRTVIVTGSNVGLGKEAARWIVQLGASRVILACRNIEKGEAAAKDIRATTSCSPDTLQVWKLDLSSYASVRAFAERVKLDLPRLDVLLANAGLGTHTFRTTEDNEEIITTNFVSTALLALLVYPKLHETAVRFDTETHITSVGSELYEVAKFKERKAPEGQLFATLADKQKTQMMDRYNVSKLLLMFFIKQMAVLAPVDSGKVIVNCVAPGLCQSDLHRDYADRAWARLLLRIFARTAEVGSRTLVYGASVGPESHGQYVPDCKITPTFGLTKGEDGKKLQERVWSELRQKLEGIHPGVTNLS